MTLVIKEGGALKLESRNEPRYEELSWIRGKCEEMRNFKKLNSLESQSAISNCPQITVNNLVN